MTETVQAPKALLQAQKLANLTDNKVRIPFIGVRLGLDFLIGLIPVIGDLIMAGVSLSIVAVAKSISVPRALRIAMLKNIGIDFLLGLIPFVGDVVDLLYKSNQKMCVLWKSGGLARIINKSSRTASKLFKNG